jgi:hypothetical protein
VRVRGGKWEIVGKLPVNKFGRMKIDASIAELKEACSMVKELLGKKLVLDSILSCSK